MNSTVCVIVRPDYLSSRTNRGRESALTGACARTGNVEVLILEASELAEWASTKNNISKQDLFDITIITLHGHILRLHCVDSAETRSSASAGGAVENAVWAQS